MEKMCIHKTSYLQTFVLPSEEYYLQRDLRDSAHLTAQLHHQKHVVTVLIEGPGGRDTEYRRIRAAKVPKGGTKKSLRLRRVRR